MAYYALAASLVNVKVLQNSYFVCHCLYTAQHYQSMLWLLPMRSPLLELLNFLLQTWSGYRTALFIKMQKEMCWFSWVQTRFSWSQCWFGIQTFSIFQRLPSHKFSAVWQQLARRVWVVLCTGYSEHPSCGAEAQKTLQRPRICAHIYYDCYSEDFRNDNLAENTVKQTAEDVLSKSFKQGVGIEYEICMCTQIQIQTSSLVWDQVHCCTYVLWEPEHSTGQLSGLPSCCSDARERECGARYYELYYFLSLQYITSGYWWHSNKSDRTKNPFWVDVQPCE